MRVTITCPNCDGEQSADVWIDFGGTYPDGTHEQLIGLEWEPPEGPYACYCERTGEDEQRVIDAAGEDPRW